MDLTKIDWAATAGAKKGSAVGKPKDDTGGKYGKLLLEMNNHFKRDFNAEGVWHAYLQLHGRVGYNSVLNCLRRAVEQGLIEVTSHHTVDPYLRHKKANPYTA